jgi:ribosomal RNA methyltransferase Nop2
VIKYAINNRPVKLVQTGLEFGVEGFTKYVMKKYFDHCNIEFCFISFKGLAFHPLMKYCRRYYPHLHNLDGFFVAKLKKYSTKQGNKKGIFKLNHYFKNEFCLFFFRIRNNTTKERTGRK